ncbi:MAG: hypothetical protein R6V54_08740 [Desulfobacteraceae bacterium]
MTQKDGLTITSATLKWGQALRIKPAVGRKGQKKRIWSKLWSRPKKILIYSGEIDINLWK